MPPAKVPPHVIALIRSIAELNGHVWPIEGSESNLCPNCKYSVAPGHMDGYGDILPFVVFFPCGTTELYDVQAHWERVADFNKQTGAKFYVNE